MPDQIHQNVRGDYVRISTPVQNFIRPTIRLRLFAVALLPPLAYRICENAQLQVTQFWRVRQQPRPLHRT